MLLRWSLSEAICRRSVQGSLVSEATDASFTLSRKREDVSFRQA